MASISFDPAASFYDATRGYPPGVAEQIAGTIAEAAHATTDTTFLEVGVGTGRIGFPLAARGHKYTGIDISEKMLEQLEGKLRNQGWQESAAPWGSAPDENPAAQRHVHRFAQPDGNGAMRLVMSDMTALPFHDQSFDAAVAVHVFHLVDDWRQAVNEVLRVVRPGGFFLHCRDGRGNKEDDHWGMLATWDRILEETGWVRPRSVSVRGEVTELLRERGLAPEEIRATQWEFAITPRQELDMLAKRLLSSTWVIPDDVFIPSVERLEAWARDTFGADGMEVPRKITRQFVISRVRV